MKAEGAPVFRRIGLRGLLSFGEEETLNVPLSPLNVIIGPNGSGKSNLVEAFSLLRAVPRDLHQPIRKGGGVKDWLWQGPPPAGQAFVGVELRLGPILRSTNAEHHYGYGLTFGAINSMFQVVDEYLTEFEDSQTPAIRSLLLRDYQEQVLRSSTGEDRIINPADIDLSQSILSQRRDPDLYPEMSRLADVLGKIRIYRSFQFGPDAVLRSSCRADVRTDYLEENLENLPARLAAMKRNPATKRRLLEHLNELAPGFDDLEIVPEGGALQLYLIEGERSIAAHRLSDGTLRYLCLLAILLDPGPTSLLIIEEPELGLHPDVVSSLCRLMIETSAKTQLLVTTHSTQLLDALTDHADSVLVCEKPESQTQITRLKQADIDALKDQGGLGWLWMRGHLGGTRW